MRQIFATKSPKEIDSSKIVSSNLNITSILDLCFILTCAFVLSAGFTNEGTYRPIPVLNATTHLSGGVTILLFDDAEVYWYEGILESKDQIHLTNYSDNGLRKILNNSKIFYRSKNIQLSVTIKTNRTTSYENVINSIDELRITDIKRYAVQDMSIDESQMIPKISL